MKIAVTAKAASLSAQMDPRFGRAAFILIIDLDTMQFEAVDNSENVRAFEGAGIQAATMISDRGAEVLLTGYCGPKAFKTLEVAEIKVVNDMEGTVLDAVNAFREGRFTYSDGANAEAHW